MLEVQRQETAGGDTEPLVTAVICTYRRANLVTQAIRSVQNQTYKNIEIIVIDNASPDNTEEVIAGLNDQRIRYIRHEQNKGPSGGRNSGIEAANGSYVAFLDDDDEWKPNKIEQQLRFLEKLSVDAVLCAFYVNNTRVRWYGKQQVTLNQLRRGNEFAPGSGLFGRTDALREVWFDESIRHGEDWDVLIRLADKAPIAYLNEPLYNVSDGGHESITNAAKNQSVNLLEERLRVVYKHQDIIGPFWTKRHMAMVLLSYFWHRQRKLSHLAYTVRRCGLLPVMSAFSSKVIRKIDSVIRTQRLSIRS